MQGITPEYPNIKGYEYLIQHLQNLGFGTSGMSGFMPLTFQEINAYMQCTSTPLTPDEVLILKDMSNEYCKFINDKNPSTKSPDYKDDTKSN